MNSSIEPNLDRQEHSAPTGKLILVVDDNEEMRDLNRDILELGNYKVLTAVSGAEALATLSKGIVPDLILTDVRMQEMSGLEFLTTLEKEMPEIFAKVPVVFFSALDTLPPSKAAGVIRKPVEIDKLLEAVKHFIAAQPSLSFH